jgi:hypothetical protein
MNDKYLKAGTAGLIMAGLVAWASPESPILWFTGFSAALVLIGLMAK